MSRGRTVTEVVEAVDPAPYLAILEQRFGIAPGIFDDYIVFRANASTLAIVRRDLSLPRAPDPVALGMPFFYPRMRHPRPTSAAVLKFGEHATRNVLDLDDPEVLDFAFGREIVLGAAAGVDGPGWVIGRYRGSVVGMGRCWQADGRQMLTGMVPKAWAAQLEDRA